VPTHKETEAFLRDFDQLSPAQKRRFRIAVRKFVEDLKAKRPPRAGLGIEKYESAEGVFGFHWAPDGRALFRYGTSPHPGDVHIIWLSIGTHDIY
jgi:hypothetical protein